MNREMRRLQAKEEERAKKRRAEGPRPKRSSQGEKLSVFQRVRKYFREVKQELKKVAWPSREELTTYTIVVFGVTTILTFVVFGLDWAFNRAVINVLEAIT
ncbi:MAG: preprotein translocase subunit SecE [Acidimicrobiia bacterium]|nr:preprotein translocase subunit SecE [Acidimicrobiia bacterium]